MVFKISLRPHPSDESSLIIGRVKDLYDVDWFVCFREIQKELIDHIPAYGWLPIGLAMKLGPDGQVDIREYHDEVGLAHKACHWLKSFSF